MRVPATAYATVVGGLGNDGIGLGELTGMLVAKPPWGPGAITETERGRAAERRP